MATILSFGDGTTFSQLGGGDAGALSERFRVWRGRSGRRYVFTRLDEPFDPAELGEAVLLVARGAVGGAMAAEAFVEVEDLARVGSGRSVWVHHLAATELERARLRRDLDVGGGEASAGICRAA